MKLIGFGLFSAVSIASFTVIQTPSFANDLDVNKTFKSGFRPGGQCEIDSLIDHCGDRRVLSIADGSCTVQGKTFPCRLLIDRWYDEGRLHGNYVSHVRQIGTNNIYSTDLGIVNQPRPDIKCTSGLALVGARKVNISQITMYSKGDYADGDTGEKLQTVGLKVCIQSDIRKSGGKSDFMYD